MASQGSSQKKVGPYVILEKIGTGSFATVFRAAHTSANPQQLDAVVAIKAIERRRLNAKLQEAIDSEIEIMEKIRHKNIVRLFGCHKTRQHIYLVLEYCAGGDLHHYIHRQGTLSADVAQHFMRELAQGLEFLWRHALVHRDLKPHNLLLSSYSPSAQLKIADFGFARHLGEALLAETLCGSPLYMAPEILSHHKYDAKADLWSVGTILYEMLAGKPPFSGSTPHELLQNIQRIELRIPSTADTTPESVDLLRRLLRRKPTERISFQEFFESKYLALRSSTSPGLSEKPKAFADLDSKPGLLEPVVEDANSSNDEDMDDQSLGKLPMVGEFDEDFRGGGDAAAGGAFTRKATPPATTTAGKQDVGLDDAWEFVEEAIERRPQQPMAGLMQPTVPNVALLSATPSAPSSRPPLHPPSSSNNASKRTPLVALQQKRKHALGRATTFAVQVGERAVHLAKLAERIVDAYEDFVKEDCIVTEEPVACECASAASAALVVEAFRLLTLSLAAAEDAADAARRQNRVGGTTALVQEIKAWLLACKDKAEALLAAASSAGTIPNARLIMFKVALGLGRRAAGRELLVTDSGVLRSDLVTVVEDYSLGLMLLQLLTVSTDLSSGDRRQVQGYLALFHQRLQIVEAL